MEIPDKIFFKIGEVSDIAGVKPYVLRYWESEFSISPHKSGSGQRLYRRKDIERILLIKRLLYQEGFTIAGARKHLSKLNRGGAPDEGDELDSAAEEALAEAAAMEETGGSEVAEAASGDVDSTPSVAQDAAGLPQIASLSPAVSVVLNGPPESIDVLWLEQVRKRTQAIQALIREAKALKVV